MLVWHGLGSITHCRRANNAPTIFRKQSCEYCAWVLQDCSLDIGLPALFISDLGSRRCSSNRHNYRCQCTSHMPTVDLQIQCLSHKQLVYMYTYIHMYKYIYISIYIHTHIFIFITHIYICMYVCISTHIHIRVYISIYLSIYLNIPGVAL